MGGSPTVESGEQTFDATFDGKNSLKLPYWIGKLRYQK